MCYYPINLKPRLNEDTGEIISGILAPCGRCMECLNARRSAWTFRLMQELKVAKSAQFITLTYNNENIPENNSLKKKDLQNFFKRIRKRTKEKFKYYAVGEYGSNTYRPHYHAIIFGLKPSLIREAWTINGSDIGNISVDSVTQASIHYVTGYLMNKEEFDNKGIKKKWNDDKKQKPFAVMSKGIGLPYVENAKKYHIENKTTKANFNEYQGHLSRYLKQKIFMENEKLRLEITEKEYIEFQESLKTADGKRKKISAKAFSKKLHEYSQRKKTL